MLKSEGKDILFSLQIYIIILIVFFIYKKNIGKMKFLLWKFDLFYFLCIVGYWYNY